MLKTYKRGTQKKEDKKMARVKFVTREELTGDAVKAWDSQEANNNLTNMKKALLNDYATYDAYMAWYTSWARLVEVIGEKDAILYSHAISTTNGCQLCSLFFISDVKGLGLDPANLQYDEKEKLLTDLGRQIVKDPTKVTDETFDELHKYFSDPEIVAIVGYAGQMIATNNFNSVLKIDVDKRLLPIINEFKPVTWRDDIK